jgi:hypothetical protein
MRIITSMSTRNVTNCLQVHEFSGVTDSARRILSSMSKRDTQQKMILSFVAVVLLIAIIVTIYFNVK